MSAQRLPSTLTEPRTVTHRRPRRAPSRRAGARLALGLAVGLPLVARPVAAQAGTSGRDSVWDITQPRGQTREINFETREGTWMSLDLTPDGRWIVFDLLGQVYRVAPVGGAAECLTEDSGITLNFHPRVSPDGRSIAFISDRRGQYGLWLMDLDGKNPRPVALDSTVRFSHPEWSADGRFIYVERSPGAIWLFHRDGGRGTEVIAPESERRSTRPVTSRDGRLLFHELASTRLTSARDILQGGAVQLAEVDLVTGERRMLTSGVSNLQWRLTSGGAYAQEVSPDGRWLSFVRRIPDGTITFKGQTFGPRAALWLRELASGAERLLMDPVELDLAEASFATPDGIYPRYRWAPDGRSIVILQGGKIRRVEVATGRVTTIPFVARVRRTISEQARGRFKLTDSPLEVRYTQWPSRSPNGRRLLFQAAGRVWVQDLPSGRPVRLTPSSFAPLEYAPAWAPDGQMVTFVSRDAVNRGHLWTSVKTGQAPAQLTREPGEYANPVFSPDGAAVVVVRGPGVTAHGRGLSSSEYFDLVRVPAAGGTPVTLAQIDWPTTPYSRVSIPRPSFGPGGRIFFPALKVTLPNPFQGVYPPMPDLVELASVRSDGGDRQSHAQFLGSDDVTLSPDGRWAAFVRAGDVYLTVLPYRGTAGTLPRFDKRGGAAPVTRLTTRGGLFPSWRSATVLDYGSGPRAYRYDVTTEQAETTAVTLRVPRAVSGGSVALTGARIITLDRRGVIERGTIVVRGARIACVGACATTEVERVIDVRGATIVPGWIDMHAHHHHTNAGFLPPRNFETAIYLAYGVTTTLDPYAWSPERMAGAELVEAGEMIGPRMFTTGEPAGGDIVSLEVALQEAGRRQDWGAVSLKQYALPTRQQRQWVMEAGRRLGLPVTAEGTADLPYRLSLAMDGHTGVEHPLTIVPLYGDVTTFLGAAKIFYSPVPLVGGPGPWNEAYFWQESEVWKDPMAQRWLPWRQLIPHTRRRMLRPVTDYSTGLLAQGMADIINAGGYGALGAHGQQHGIGTHWDIWIAAMAMSTMEALEVASVHGAKMLGMDEDLGSLTSGKLADLVVLNANPLENIRNTANLRYVMKAGVLYDAPTLDQLWPRPEKFGEYYWVVPEVYRADNKPVDVWDVPAGRSGVSRLPPPAGAGRAGLDVK